VAIVGLTGLVCGNHIEGFVVASIKDCPAELAKTAALLMLKTLIPPGW